ncbi:hypothetical protein OC842_004033 [Tilletia horrida]|uniref:Endopeptidase S2P n=1 Tax=Tilletia horrida TaxID=155126 RepID=A0AAN6GAP3_9BASI|nr:hypothetical protein OC842_004033 [Tilletia horrida]
MLELSRHALTLSTRRFNAYPRRIWAALGVLDPGAGEARAGLSTDADSTPAQQALTTKRRRRRRHALVTRLYDAGTIFGILAVLGAVSIVILAGFQLIWRVLELEGELEQAFWQGAEAGGALLPDADAAAAMGAAGVPQALRRRDGGVGAASGSGPGLSNPSIPPPSSPTDTSSGPLLTPLIPGITVPLWHIVPILLALFLCQVIHESGHALAAALSHISPLSTGLAVVFPCMPSAFVALPTSALAIFASEADADAESSNGLDYSGIGTANGRVLPLNEQLRIIAAGVWHNALTVLLFLFARTLFKEGNQGEPPLIAISGPAILFDPLFLVLDYVFTLSLALAVLNMLPLWGMDGEAFGERIALVLMRRRNPKDESTPVGMGPWNGYAIQNTSDGRSRAGGRLLNKANGAPNHHQQGQSSMGTGAGRPSWPAFAKKDGDGGSFRGRMRGGSDADGMLLDLEQGGGAGRYAMTSLGSGPTTVSMAPVPMMDPGNAAHPILASPEEEKILRAVRTRTRGVLGLATIAVLGGSIVLEFVLALQ